MDLKCHGADHHCQFMGNQGTEEHVTWNKGTEQQNSESGKLQGQNLGSSTNEFQERKKKREGCGLFQLKGT